MNEDIMHVRLEHDEAIKSKRNLLLIEMGTLKAIQGIRNYKHLRTQELKEKTRLIKKLKDTLADLRKMHRILPKIKINKINESKKPLNQKETKKEKQQRKKEQKYTLTLEQELQEIQRKLKSL